MADPVQPGAPTPDPTAIAPAPAEAQPPIPEEPVATPDLLPRNQKAGDIAAAISARRHAEAVQVGLEAPPTEQPTPPAAVPPAQPPQAPPQQLPPAAATPPGYPPQQPVPPQAVPPTPPPVQPPAPHPLIAAAGLPPYAITQPQPPASPAAVAPQPPAPQPQEPLYTIEVYGQRMQVPLSQLAHYAQLGVAREGMDQQRIQAEARALLAQAGIQLPGVTPPQPMARQPQVPYQVVQPHQQPNPPGQPGGPPAQPSPRALPLTDEEIAATARAIQYGEGNEPAEALKKLLGKLSETMTPGQPNAPTTLTPEQMRQVVEFIEYRTATQQFASEFSDILQDQNETQIAAQYARAVRTRDAAANLWRPDLEVFREAGNLTRAWRQARFASVFGAQVPPMQQPQPAAPQPMVQPQPTVYAAHYQPPGYPVAPNVVPFNPMAARVAAKESLPQPPMPAGFTPDPAQFASPTDQLSTTARYVQQQRVARGLAPG